MSVSALVYVAARAPDAGEDFGALAAKFPKPPASDGVVRANGFFWLSEEAFLREFARDLEPGRARTLYAVQGRGADALPTGRTTAAAWRTKPCWYQVSTEDRTINPELERFLAKRMKATTIERKSSHVSLISHPREIAEPKDSSDAQKSTMGNIDRSAHVERAVPRAQPSEARRMMIEALPA
jgi:pimeloyl-ACP methyl ester carboxylesterase